MDKKCILAVEQIKSAILKSQFNAIRLANQEQLKLYFSIGKYISEKSRNGYWGSGALEIISNRLKQDLPGLMGFGLSSLKNMRLFYESWSMLEDKSPTAVGNLQNTDNSDITIQQLQLSNLHSMSIDTFLTVPFTHHIRIIEGGQVRSRRRNGH